MNHTIKFKNYISLSLSLSAPQDSASSGLHRYPFGLKIGTMNDTHSVDCNSFDDVIFLHMLKFFPYLLVERYGYVLCCSDTICSCSLLEFYYYWLALNSAEGNTIHSFNQL